MVKRTKQAKENARNRLPRAVNCPPDSSTAESHQRVKVKCSALRGGGRSAQNPAGNRIE